MMNDVDIAYRFAHDRTVENISLDVFANPGRPRTRIQNAHARADGPQLLNKFPEPTKPAPPVTKCSRAI